MPHFGSIKWSGGKVKKNYEKSFAIGPVIKQNEKNYIQSIGDCAHWTPYIKYRLHQVERFYFTSFTFVMVLKIQFM